MTQAALWMPAFGRIEGGAFDGWRYAFERFDVDAGELRVVATCTPPHWPFPRPHTVLRPGDYRSLIAVPGERAPRRRAEPLIARAFRLADQPLPAWLASSDDTALWADTAPAPLNPEES